MSERLKDIKQPPPRAWPVTHMKARHQIFIDP
jgi:hypothetical protein